MLFSSIFIDKYTFKTFDPFFHNIIKSVFLHHRERGFPILPTFIHTLL